MFKKHEISNGDATYSYVNSNKNPYSQASNQVSITQLISKKSYDGRQISSVNQSNGITQDKIFPTISDIAASQVANISFAVNGDLNSFFPTDNTVNPFYENSDGLILDSNAGTDSGSTTNGSSTDNTGHKTHFKIFSGLDVGVNSDTNSFTCPKDYPYVRAYQLQRNDKNRIFTSAIYRNVCVQAQTTDGLDLLYGSAQLPSNDNRLNAINIDAFIPRNYSGSCAKDLLDVNLTIDNTYIKVNKVIDGNNIIGLNQEKSNLNNNICKTYCGNVKSVLCANNEYSCLYEIRASIYKHNRYYRGNVDEYFCACEFYSSYGTGYNANSVVDIENIAKYKNLISSVTCGN